jgi:hypothetical protein
MVSYGVGISPSFVLLNSTLRNIASGTVTSGAGWQEIKTFSKSSQVIDLKIYNSQNSRYSTVSFCLFNSDDYFSFLNDDTEYNNTELVLTNGITLKLEMVSGTLNVSFDKQGSDYDYEMSWVADSSYTKLSGTVTSGSGWVEVKEFALDSKVITLKVKNKENNIYSIIPFCLFNSQDYFSFLYDNENYSDTEIVLTNGITLRFEMVSGTLNISMDKQVSDYDYEFYWKYDYKTTPTYSAIISGSSYVDVATIPVTNGSSDIVTAYVAKDDKFSKSQVSYKEDGGSVSICSIGNVDDFAASYEELLINGVIIKYTGGTNEIIVSVKQEASSYTAASVYKFGGF